MENKQKDETDADRALIAGTIDVGDRFNLRRSHGDVRVDKCVYVNDSVREHTALSSCSSSLNLDPAHNQKQGL